MCKLNALAPVFIKSDIKESIKIIDGIVLKLMTPDIKSTIKETLQSGWIALTEELINSNYYFEFIDVEEKDLNSYALSLSKALRLINLGCSGLLYVFIKGGNIRRYVETEYHQRGNIPTTLNVFDINNFIELFKKISISKDKKFDLIIYKYLFNSSGIAMKEENRFVDYMTILEMLYAGGANQELKFRLSLSIAKMLLKHNLNFKPTVEEMFDKVKDFYDARSQLVHTGMSKKFNVEASCLLPEITRLSILLYINYPEEFNDKNLKKLLCE